MKDSTHHVPLDLTAFLPFQMAIVSSRLFQRMMSEAGLQLPEWRIMMALPRHAPCSSNDLCVLTAMDAARVSRAQRRLDELGMIEVIQDQEDRRRLVVTLTDRGQEESDRLNDLARDAEDQMFGNMSEYDQDTLRSALTSLYARS
ncbi:MAG: MarR family winged helix-turn-helix transcriptional regulator [Pseudomonadota bacterium]